MSTAPQMIRIGPDDLRDLCADRVRLAEWIEASEKLAVKEAQRETAREHAVRDLATSQSIRLNAAESMVSILEELDALRRYSQTTFGKGPAKRHLLHHLSTLAANLDNLRKYIQV